MLRYEINTKTARTDLEMLDVSAVESTEVPFEGTNRMLVTCYVNSRNAVQENDTVVAIYDIETNDQYGSSRSNLVSEFSVVGVNKVNLSFNIICDKYHITDAEFARKETSVIYVNGADYQNVEYLTIYFGSYHHLRGEDLDKKTCLVYLSDAVTTSVEQMLPMKGEIVDNYTVRFNMTDKNNQEAYDRIFYVDSLKTRNYAPLTHFKILQEHFLFHTNTDGSLYHTTLYVQKNAAELIIPLTNKFSTELYSNINVTGFVNKEVDNALNVATENEKDVYRPILKDINGQVNVNKLKLNFHFRQRSGDQWIVDQTSTWNGVTVRPPSTDSDSYKPVLSNEFFSYTNQNEQSDLLGYLSFTNEDVKYQRNVLKKSFVRLLFYDSTDPFKQRLLSYSTIFVDTGELLNKYMRCIEKDYLGFGYLTYKNNRNNSEPSIVTGLNGIRVDRELNIDHSNGDDDELEGCRLSSQLVVCDKFTASNSSEGFYLYLWKDNVGDGIPNDLYMKVEFNHAKFGRVIPFMMPYDDNGRIKSFNAIVEDVIDKNNGENKGYTMEVYQKYAYIHLKYEKENGQYVYYLDENYNVDMEDNALTLNLYEANVR